MENPGGAATSEERSIGGREKKRNKEKNDL